MLQLELVGLPDSIESHQFFARKIAMVQILSPNLHTDEKKAVSADVPIR